MKKIILIIALVLYAISFTPKAKSIVLEGQEIESEAFLSIFPYDPLYGTIVPDFIFSTLNTALFDLPCHYGTFYNLFSNKGGNRLITFSFRTVISKPIYPSIGWSLGIFFGWILRLTLLFIIIYKLRKQP